MNVHASRTLICLGALAMSLTACSRGTMSAADALHSKTIHSSPTMLTHSELVSVEDGKNLWDAVYILRPSFLRGRNDNPTLAINGQLVGSATYMANMMPDEVESVELLNGLDATTRFGSHHTGTVLLVRTRGR